ncbi:MAG TPA: hypothetical protein VMV45_03080 [Casimicrobiaceae bacterium]|nr:hypothetical protein [Casimicrobiaceae bacterium]
MRVTDERPVRRCGIIAALLAVISIPAFAVAPTADEIAQRCTGADDRAQCGRRIEEMQLARLPNLARRDGDTLTVNLFPAGTKVYRDNVQTHGEKTYALWDYFDWINAVLLFTTDGERSGFLLLQRASGRDFALPSDPALSPDRKRLATADFCRSACDNEVVVWRVDRDRIARELSWRPSAPWADASVRWKDADTLVFDYSVAGNDSTRTLERRLSAPDWLNATR